MELRGLVLAGVFLSAGGLVACSGPSAVPQGTRLVELGAICLHVPEFSARANDASPFWPGFRKSDSERAATFRFPNEEIARQIGGYRIPRTVTGQPQSGLLVGVVLATPQEFERSKYAAKYFGYDIWYGVGEYPDRTIEPVPGTSFYRIRPIAAGRSWKVVRTRPDQTLRDAHLQEDFWIASCSKRPDGGREVDCQSHVANEENGFLFKIYLSEENIRLRHELAEYVSAQLASWQTRCPG